MLSLNPSTQDFAETNTYLQIEARRFCIFLLSSSCVPSSGTCILTGLYNMIFQIADDLLTAMFEPSQFKGFQSPGHSINIEYQDQYTG